MLIIELSTSIQPRVEFLKTGVNIVCVRVCVRACVCVCVEEREKERERTLKHPRLAAIRNTQNTQVVSGHGCGLVKHCCRLLIFVLSGPKRLQRHIHGIHRQVPLFQVL